jgi:hypothetical protein
MTSRDFCYWLMGIFEGRPAQEGLSLNVEQTSTIRKHLNLVFLHEIDPSFPVEKQAMANQIHHGDASGAIMRC